jgi:hypothetical protein
LYFQPYIEAMLLWCRKHLHYTADVDVKRGGQLNEVLLIVLII